MITKIGPVARQMLRQLRRYGPPAALSLAVLLALLLPLNLLVTQRLHHDEALYATWALKIATGLDPWLRDTPIDKPPLFLYTVASAINLLGPTETAVRLPSLLATALIVLLTFFLGRTLYRNHTGLLAAWLVALSPFTIMFAPTTLTDPLLVALVMAGALAAASGRAGWAGVCLALATATKQQGVFFLPLALGLLWVQNPQTANGNLGQLWRTGRVFLLAFLLTLLPALLWDLNRNFPSGFFEQSLANYGGLTPDLTGFGQRWWGFVDLLFYATASPLLNALFIAGLPLLLGYGSWQAIKRRRPSPFYADALLLLYSLAFVGLHALLSFQIWDRYLLGLIPLLALLLARLLCLPCQFLRDFWPQPGPAIKRRAGLVLGIALLGLLALALSGPVQDAANGRLPLGSNSRALSGIEQIVAYLQGHAGANHTLYHRWLGTHWRFYLWGYPYDLQYWNSPAQLAARAKPGQLLAHPAWRSDTEARLALFEAGLALHELARAYTPGGAPSIILYQIQAAPQ